MTDTSDPSRVPWPRLPPVISTMCAFKLDCGAALYMHLLSSITHRNETEANGLCLPYLDFYVYAHNSRHTNLITLRCCRFMVIVPVRVFLAHASSCRCFCFDLLPVFRSWCLDSLTPFVSLFTALWLLWQPTTQVPRLVYCGLCRSSSSFPSCFSSITVSSSLRFTHCIFQITDNLHILLFLLLLLIF